MSHEWTYPKSDTTWVQGRNCTNDPMRLFAVKTTVQDDIVIILFADAGLNDAPNDMIQVEDWSYCYRIRPNSMAQMLADLGVKLPDLLTSLQRQAIDDAAKTEGLSPNHPASGNLTQEEMDESGYDGPMVQRSDQELAADEPADEQFTSETD